MYVGTIFSVLRTSLGDFDFDGAAFLEDNENILFWIIWFLIVVVTCIVFLNFIIAEASASYEAVKERLDAEIVIARSKMIVEAENIEFDRFKTPEKYPRYIVIRTIET